MDETTTITRYRVWHIPQIPGPAFYVPAADLATAVLVMDTLGDYDLFQLEQRVKPDYSNASGIEERDESGEWYEVDEDEIREVRGEQ